MLENMENNNDQTICSRCGEELNSWTTIDNIVICDDCLTDDEQYEIYCDIHKALYGHHPESPECHCEDK